MRQLLLAVALVAGVALSGIVLADTLISKAEVERLFAMRRSEWDAYAPRLADPKWKIRLSESSTGVGVMAFDPSTGLGMSVQPLYTDETGPPMMLVVGTFYPAGKPPASLSASRKELERKARRDLGSRYLVRARPVSLPPSWEGIELTVTRPK